MSRLAAAVLLTATAGLATVATHHHKRGPGVASSATLAEVVPLRASRAQERLPLSGVQPARPRRAKARQDPPRRGARPALGSGYLNWTALAQCESSGNPHAVDPSGTYFGLYQFDLQTWRSVGGTGNPADASPEEQRKRAWLLYIQRGRAPWPQCGRYL
jgi:hypothetical protein